jgi:hypothetical protein
LEKYRTVSGNVVAGECQALARTELAHRIGHSGAKQAAAGKLGHRALHVVVETLTKLGGE